MLQIHHNKCELLLSRQGEGRTLTVLLEALTSLFKLRDQLHNALLIMLLTSHVYQTSNALLIMLNEVPLHPDLPPLESDLLKL